MRQKPKNQSLSIIIQSLTKAQFKRILDENKQLQNHVKQLQNENKQLQNHVKQLQNDNEKMQNLINELQDIVKEKNQIIERYKSGEKILVNDCVKKIEIFERKLSKILTDS